MTNHWIDIKHSDVILIMGSNPAENHPISFKRVTEAIDNGATLISLDPRFTRTSSKAHIYARIRSGTDIAFLGGLIKYILHDDLYHREYVVEHTNAPFLVNPKSGFHDGVFTGYDPQTRKYDKSTWTYQTDANGVPLEDPTLQDPPLCLPTAEEALRPLRRGHCVPDHRHAQGRPHAGLPGLCRHGRTGQGGHHHVRHGLDPTYLRHSEHPNGGDHPVAAGEHRPGRRGQWRWKAVDPPGEARPDSWIINQLMIRLRKLYAADPGPNPILKLAWDYGDGEVNVHQVAKEVNGWAVHDVLDKDGKVLVPAGKQVKNFTQLRDDGSTACANWLYSGSYNEASNMMARRDNTDTHPAGLGLYANWPWAWPVNRRIIYNWTK